LTALRPAGPFLEPFFTFTVPEYPVMSHRDLRHVPALLTTALLAFTACGGSDTGGVDAGDLALHCADGNGGLILPDGFCAIVVSEGLGPARHLEVAPNGDVFVALRDSRETRDGPLVPGALLALRDTDGDGIFDRSERWGVSGGNDVVLSADASTVYFATNDAVIRFARRNEYLTPFGTPDTIVAGLPADRNHTAKSIALGPDGSLFVNIGSPSNACQAQDRQVGSPGQDPCPELEARAGIWRFDGTASRQTQDDGTRFATGLRNVVALRWHPTWNLLFGVQHGRDQLHELYPELFTEEDNAETPAEEFVRIEQGSDFGWPYCYYDGRLGQRVLAPEYGGDGTEVGRCADMNDPLLALPAHWAPNDLEFYTGSHFPERYRDGAFIAFHGSWNRAPLPQEGFNVVFVPMTQGIPSGEWEVFADGFRAEEGDARGWSARPVGVAMAPDGTLYVIDSMEGRLWRIVWRGSESPS
jgi:glucose/arabinose dehydrogenase